MLDGKVRMTLGMDTAMVKKVIGQWHWGGHGWRKNIIGRELEWVELFNTTNEFEPLLNFLNHFCRARYVLVL